jgi:hypothetical protein
LINEEEADSEAATVAAEVAEAATAAEEAAAGAGSNRDLPLRSSK